MKASQEFGTFPKMALLMTHSEASLVRFKMITGTINYSMVGIHTYPQQDVGTQQAFGLFLLPVPLLWVQFSSLLNHNTTFLLASGSLLPKTYEK